jgi:hypothetical protein
MRRWISPGFEEAASRKRELVTNPTPRQVPSSINPRDFQPLCPNILTCPFIRSVASEKKLSRRENRPPALDPQFLFILSSHTVKENDLCTASF